MSKRYFINNIDTFIGNSLLQELIKDKDLENEESNIMATLTNPTEINKPKGRYKPKLSRKKMLEECDTFIYDLHFDTKDIQFAIDVLKSAPLEEQKTLILISNVMTWSNTPPKEKVEVPEEKPEEENNEEGEKKENEENEENEENKEKNEEEANKTGDEAPKFDEEGNPIDYEVKEEEPEVIEEKPKVFVPYKEDDYQMRIASEKYQSNKEIEDLLLSLKIENLKVFIVCAGVLIGKGEIIFENHFKAAWLQDPFVLPYLGDGENKIPTIHISDLSKFVIKVAESIPEGSPYLFAVDNSNKRTQKEIVKAISKGVGSGKIDSFEEHGLISQEMEDVFKLDLDLIPSRLLVDEENPTDFEWTCEVIKKMLFILIERYLWRYKEIIRRI